jgi:putative membrane protein
VAQSDQAGADQTVDATRRTQLASERTYLAWWRSGLTAIALGFAAGKVVPGLTDGSQWQYEALGVGYGALGTAVFGYGLLRQRRLERALAQGTYAPLGAAGTIGLAAAGALLGLVTILVVLLV